MRCSKEPCPGDTESPLTQHFSTAGSGHKGFPTWITAPSLALMIKPSRWLSQGLDGAGRHRGPPQGRRQTSQPPTCAGNDALSPSFLPMNSGEKTLQFVSYLPPPRRAKLSPKCP